MSDREEQLELVRHAAETLLPQLTERLVRLQLGELEVQEGELRLRVVGAAAIAPTVGASPRSGANEASAAETNQAPAATRQGVTSPAVGFFVYADALGPGLDVQKGDELGHVEVLGIRHDVRAPRSGTVTNLVSEAGEPVEYGQLLIEMEPGG
jgi:acetyl-CoA carboxylase biotin carboxyl carrier protein